MLDMCKCHTKSQWVTVALTDSSVTALCSEGPMFRRSYVQKVLCSEGPLCRRSYVQRVLCSEGPMFRRFYVHKVLYSEGPMFRNICSEGPMFRKYRCLFEWLRGKVIRVYNSFFSLHVFLER